MLNSGWNVYSKISVLIKAAKTHKLPPSILGLGSGFWYRAWKGFTHCSDTNVICRKITNITHAIILLTNKTSSSKPKQRHTHTLQEHPSHTSDSWTTRWCGVTKGRSCRDGEPIPKLPFCPTPERPRICWLLVQTHLSCWVSAHNKAVPAQPSGLTAPW